MDTQPNHGRSRLKLLTLREVLARTAEGRSTHFAKRKEGLFVLPVATGPRSRRTPEHECDAIIAARIAGASDEEIRKLVRALEAHRKEFAP
jgi:prophage regulatory protein